MHHLVVEIDSREAELFGGLGEEHCRLVGARALSGADVLHAVVVLSAVTIVSVKQIVIELIRARKNVRIWIDGVEAHNVNVEAIRSELENVIKADTRDSP